MPNASDRTDPRTIVTPDAFSVAPGLLGLPLAHPWRRAAAMAVDLVLVAILANASGVFFAFAAGIFVFWLAVRKRGEVDAAASSSATSRRAARVGLGCLAAVVLTVASLVTWFSLVIDDEVTEPVADLIALARGGDSAQVAAAADRMVELLRDRDVPPDEMRGVIEQLRADSIGDSLTLRRLEAAVARVDSIEAAEAAAAATENGGGAEPGPGVDTTGVDYLAGRYAAARAAGDSAAIVRYGEPLGRALAARAIADRDDEIARAESRIADLRDELDETEEALDEERRRGILSTVYALLDDVGLGLGWSGLYFTFFLGFWRGRTPGKRLLGLRVVRLDGRPLGYWVAFERYGGYAASLFTGLEGFARLIWDPNRQALEDKLAGTVVLRETPEARRKVDGLQAKSVPAGTRPEVRSGGS